MKTLIEQETASTYVCEFYVAQCCDEHVVRLEIPVNHTETKEKNMLKKILLDKSLSNQPVQIFDSQNHFGKVEPGHVGWQRPGVLQQRSAITWKAIRDNQHLEGVKVKS